MSGGGLGPRRRVGSRAWGPATPPRRGHRARRRATACEAAMRGPKAAGCAKLGRYRLFGSRGQSRNWAPVSGLGVQRLPWQIGTIANG